MRLSKMLMARMCGGCQTRVVRRDEFLEWVAKAEELEALLLGYDLAHLGYDSQEEPHRDRG
jgi:hypothetical protein